MLGSICDAIFTMRVGLMVEFVCVWFVSTSILAVLFVEFFFFQAEDGIRDYKVTGVQTCALPI